LFFIFVNGYNFNELHKKVEKALLSEHETDSDI